MSKRRNHDAAFKARVALEALKGDTGIFERGGKAAVAAEVAEETVRDLHAKIAR